MSDLAPDTSVVIAGLASWHPDHEVARAVLAKRPTAIAHVLYESFSVLTRLPAPRKLSAELAWEALASAFPRTLRLGGVDCAAAYLHEPGNPRART